MKLTSIKKITGTLELVSGLHIGSGNTEMHIGGTDNPVIKNPDNQQPYIPGSSIKGKVRSLLEWQLGLVSLTNGKPLGFGHVNDPKCPDREQAKTLLKLFGGAPESGDKHEELAKEIGPTRLAFWDCALEKGWVEEMNRRNLLLTETKMENSIDRIQGVAANGSLRNTERVPAGAKFEFQLTLRVHDDEEKELLPLLWRGLALLELTGLGGSGSRGYGKVKFATLEMDENDQKPELDKAIKNLNA